MCRRRAWWTSLRSLLLGDLSIIEGGLTSTRGDWIGAFLEIE